MAQSPCGRRLGDRLRGLGCGVHKINFCGGDVLHWPRPGAISFRRRPTAWAAWVERFMRERGVTDVAMHSDIRGYHIDALHIARSMGLRTHVFEGGYLRPGYVTAEDFGVNGRSGMPTYAASIMAEATTLPPLEAPPDFGSATRDLVLHAARHHFGNVVLFPLFPRYRTHRPNTIARDLTGLLPRYLTRRSRKAEDAGRLSAFMAAGHADYFVYALQISGDSQVRLYSSLGNVRNTFAPVLASFRRAAPAGTGLVIRSHPLDGDIRAHRRAVASCVEALGLLDRVCYIDEGNTDRLMAGSRGVVMINSTAGVRALQLGKPSFCLGHSIYAMPGLAAHGGPGDLDRFWPAPPAPDPALVDAFLRVMRHRVLLPGDFYVDRGIDVAVESCLKRFGLV
jgi:capsular polysaccharide export protein